MMCALAAVAAVGCGGSDCGNGVIESGEQCDKGAENGQPGSTCSATCKSISVARVGLNIQWSLLPPDGFQTPIDGYQAPGCSAFGATKAHVVVNGPSPLDIVLPCTNYGVMYLAQCPADLDGGISSCTVGPLSPGDYQVTVTLQRDDSTAVTNAVSTKTTTVAAGTPVPFSVAFEQMDFLDQSLTGELDIKVSWGSDGTTCKNAQPQVTRESILLIADGQTMPVQGMTLQGTKLDGTPGQCYTGTQSAPYEQIQNLTWGLYHLAVFDKMNNYCLPLRPVFVSPGTTDNLYSITVPMPPPPPDMSMPPVDMSMGAGDGGVDDGGPPPVDMSGPPPDMAMMSCP
jgi:hypothetical protein